MPLPENPKHSLAYRTYGDPYMPALILLMGVGMPGDVWPPEFIQELVRRGLYVICPDNRDCGKSPIYPASAEDMAMVSSAHMLGTVLKYVAGGSVKAPYRLEDMAGDVEALMDELGLERAHIAGISMGAMISQVMAVKAPHRVITLTCISGATGHALTGLGKLSAVRAAMAMPPVDADDDTLKEHYRNMMKAIGTKGESYTDPTVDYLVDSLRETYVPPEAPRRQLLAILASGDRRQQLRQLRVPALVIHGTEDPLLPFSAGKETAACIEGARFMPVEGMGHDLPRKFVPQIAEAIAAHCYSRTLR